MEAPGEEGRAAPVEEEDVGNFEDSTPTVEEHSSEATQEHTTGEPESREQDHGRIPESGTASMADSHASPAGTEASQDNSATQDHFPIQEGTEYLECLLTLVPTRVKGCQQLLVICTLYHPLSTISMHHYHHSS